MSAYEARVYVPSAGLVNIHATARILGSAEITTEGLNSVQDQQGPLYNYAVGVAVPAVVMILFFFIWCCSLLCLKKCCKGCCSKNVALVLFVASCSLSILGWILGLSGNVATTQGFNSMSNGVGAVQTFSLRIVNLTDETAVFTEQLKALALNMSVQCALNDTGSSVTFPLAGISDGLDNVLTGAQDVSSTILGFNADIDTFKAMAAQYIAWREVGTMVVIIITIFILFFFMVSTTLRVMDSTPEKCRPVVNCSSRTTSCVMFIFGILLLLIIWIFVALIHLLVTVGSDVCAPSVNANVNRLANEVINQNFSGGDACLDPAFIDSGPGMICHYQTCTGPNRVEELTAPLLDNSNFSLAELSNFVQTLNETLSQYPNVTVVSQECFPSIDRFISKSTNIFGLLDKAVNLTTCPSINPVYGALLYDGVCNGLFDGLVFTYVSCIIACTFMMLAMSIFRIFDFGMYEYGRLPEADYYNPDSKKVVATGGPVTQDV